MPLPPLSIEYGRASATKGPPGVGVQPKEIKENDKMNKKTKKPKRTNSPKVVPVDAAGVELNEVG